MIDEDECGKQGKYHTMSDARKELGRGRMPEKYMYVCMCVMGCKYKYYMHVYPYSEEDIRLTIFNPTQPMQSCNCVIVIV